MTMKHQKQGNGECKLASIAMLSNTPLDIVRSIALSLAKVSNWNIIALGRDGSFEKIVTKLVRIFKLEGKILTSDKLAPLMQLSVNSFGNTKKYYPNDILPLEGEGEIFVGWKSGYAHSVAYKNGIIFDPNMARECPFNEWLELPTIKDRIKYLIV